MLTYLIMAAPFIGFALVLDMLILKTKVVKQKETWVVLLVMLAMTAVADQLLTGLPIVQYNQAHILGVRLGYVPIEDFSYTIAAVIGIGAFYRHGHKDRKQHTDR